MLVSKTSVAGALFALAGCASLPIDDVAKLLPSGVTPAVTSVAMFAGDVTAVGPNGYCVDPDSSRPKRGFAILAPCFTLGVAGAPVVLSAITTVQAGPDGSAIVSQDADGFAEYLRGPDGPFVLSRSGEPQTVQISEVRTFDRHVAVYLRDQAPARIEGAQEAEWRAFLDISGRLLTISVRGLDAAPLSSSAGSALLDQAVAAVIAANSATGS